MTKDEKGITIISLAITVIVMIIILGITLVSGTSLLEHSKLTKIETDLMLIKARAEILAEQFGFDEKIAPLISFSELEKRNKVPVVYNYSVLNNNNIRYLGYKNSNGEFSTNYSDESFNKMVNKIYTYHDLGTLDIKSYSRSSHSEVVVENFDRFLYVKWGLDECISQGIIKAPNNLSNPMSPNTEENTNQTVMNNNDKYAIVQYDLKNGTVTSIAYSKGFKNKDGIMEYTLTDLLQVDLDGE